MRLPALPTLDALFNDSAPGSSAVTQKRTLNCRVFWKYISYSVSVTHKQEGLAHGLGLLMVIALQMSLRSNCYTHYVPGQCPVHHPSEVKSSSNLTSCRKSLCLRILHQFSHLYVLCCFPLYQNINFSNSNHIKWEVMVESKKKKGLCSFLKVRQMCTSLDAMREDLGVMITFSWLSP